MTKLNQLLAIETGVRAKTTRTFTDAHRVTQQDTPLSGLTKTYQPRDEEGEELPGESTLVQTTAEREARRVATALTRLFDVVLTKDHANTLAQADVVVPGTDQPLLVLPDLPVTYLLFLEKQLQDVRTFFTKLPVLDPAFTWTLDPTSGEGVSRTEPVKTTRTKKIYQNHVLAEPTKEHPAQVQVFTVDQIVGDWTTVRFSGAVTQERKQELLERTDQLIQAVKFAREEANSADIVDQRVGESIFRYLLA